MERANFAHLRDDGGPYSKSDEPKTAWDEVHQDVNGAKPELVLSADGDVGNPGRKIHFQRGSYLQPLVSLLVPVLFFLDGSAVNRCPGLDITRCATAFKANGALAKLSRGWPCMLPALPRRLT
jgi:hypothetical protein